MDAFKACVIIWLIVGLEMTDLVEMYSWVIKLKVERT